MKKPNKIKRVLFYAWVGLAFLLLGISSDAAAHPETAIARVFNNIWAIGYLTVLNYVFFEYILPSISRRRIGMSILRLLLIIFLYSWGAYGWRLLGTALHIYTPFVSYLSLSHAAAGRMAFSMESVLFFGIIWHIYNYIKLKQAAQQLLIEKQQAELSYLKSQTNPHFLFNTLNNIYSLAKDKSDQAPESILRLSKMLRYMLYETTKPHVALEQELKIINDYIALEKLRYDDSLRVSFSHNVEDMRQALPPLLLIPLVENAFKHGVSETRNDPFVDIHLSVQQRQLVFVVKNSFGTALQEEPVKENIGLSNLRRQLELLYTGYSLSVLQEAGVFAAHLKINLGSHV